MDKIAAYGVDVQQTQTRIAFAQSAIKQQAESEKKIATILEQAIESTAEATGTRGRNIDIRV